MQAHRHRGTHSGDEHEAHEPEPAIDQHHRCGERGRLRGGGRVANANDVAANIAWKEVVEEVRDEKGTEEASALNGHVLCFQQQVPAPDAGRDIQRVERERREQPRQRCVPRACPDMCDVDPREQQRQQRKTDDDLAGVQRQPIAASIMRVQRSSLPVSSIDLNRSFSNFLINLVYS